MVRITYVEQGQLPEDMRWLFDRLEQESGRVGNIWKVLGHNAHVLRGAMILGTAILRRSKLSPRLRELAILRVGYLTGADYEYYHHLPSARRAGVTEEEIVAVAKGQDAPEYGEVERAVMALADGMTASPPSVDGATVHRLQSNFDDQELLELAMTIAYYNMLGRLMVAFDIELEADTQLGQ